MEIQAGYIIFIIPILFYDGWSGFATRNDSFPFTAAPAFHNETLILELNLILTPAEL